MSIPVPIAPGALAITDSDTSKAEALVAAVVQIIKNGTAGGTASIRTPATIIPEALNPSIDPATGLPKLVSLALDNPQSQLFYRQFALAMAKVVPGWGGGGGGPSLGDLVFNEFPAGIINGANKAFTTAYKFIGISTSFYYNGQRLLLNTDYTENIGRTGITISSLFPAPKVGDNLVIDYVKDNT